jgi:hypothetical protein
MGHLVLNVVRILPTTRIVSSCKPKLDAAGGSHLASAKRNLSRRGHADLPVPL